jgi:hypothetical protein
MRLLSLSKSYYPPNGDYIGVTNPKSDTLHKFS